MENSQKLQELEGNRLMRKKIFVRGPGMSQSGYGEQTRFALRALRTREDLFDIYFWNMPWGHTNMIVDNNEEKEWLLSLLEKTAPYLQQQQPTSHLF